MRAQHAHFIKSAEWWLTHAEVKITWFVKLGLFLGLIKRMP